jgi:hypothetical protein
MSSSLTPAFEQAETRSNHQDPSISVGDINIQGNVSGNIVVGNRNVIGNNNVIYEINADHGAIVHLYTGHQTITKRTPGSHPPRPPHAFVGRDQELNKLEEYIQQKEAVLLYGSSGMGKTTLLKKIANSDAARAMPDGVVYLDQPYEGNISGFQDILQRIFDKLFVSDPPVKLIDSDDQITNKSIVGILRRLAGKLFPNQSTKLAASVIEANLATTSPLIILDEVGLEKEALNRLVDQFPMGAVLVASQTAPDDDVFESVQVTPLNHEAAIELFVAKSNIKADENARPLIDQICGILGDIPLAIATIATAICQNRIQLDAVNTLDKLTNLIARLKKNQPTSKDRAQAALERSFGLLYYSSLNQSERELLQTVASVPSKSFDREWLENKNAGAKNSVKILENLGLLYANSPRLRVPEGLRILLRSELDLNEWSEELLEGNDGYYLKKLNERKLDMDYIASELGNILGLLEWASYNHRWGDVIKLGRAVDPYLTLKGLWDTWGSVLEQVLSAAQNINDRSTQAWAYHQLGTRQVGVGSLKQAITHLVHALRLRTALGDVGGILFTQHNLGIILPLVAASGVAASLISVQVVAGAALATAAITAAAFFYPLDLKVQANPASYDHSTQKIEYTYEVQNRGLSRITGPVEVEVNDNNLKVTCPAVNTIDNHDDFLDPGEKIVCKGDYVITQADIDNCSVTNTATASVGKDGIFKSWPESLSVSCNRTIFQPPPHGDPPGVTKTPNLTMNIKSEPSSYKQVGDVIIFSYEVTQSNNVDAAGNVTVTVTNNRTDAMEDINCPGVNTAACTSTYTITQADIDHGAVSITATAKQGSVVSKPATVDITGPAREPKLSLTKTIDSPGYNSAEQFITYSYTGMGQSITYNYTIENNGNVTLWSPYIIDDHVNKNGERLNCGSKLAPGESASCAQTHIVNMADFEPNAVTNTATAYASLSVLLSEAPIPFSAVSISVVCHKPPAGWVPYTVRSGDTLYGISAWYEGFFPETLETLQAANCMGSSTDIISGQPLYVPYLFSISGKVFLDANHNDELDDGEQGVPGFTVTLELRKNNSETIIGTAITLADGYYIFPNLPPDDYWVLQVLKRISRESPKNLEKQNFGVAPIPKTAP